jgi:hypothetical protein
MLFSCLWFLGLFNPCLHGSEAAPSEHQVKAVWLLNFARFCEWPTNAFAHRDGPFLVGVMGKDPFGNNLEKAFEGKSFKGRPFAFRRISTGEEAKGCQILFVQESDRRKTRDLAQKLQRLPILTVGDANEFLDDGGIINFLLKDNTVRFEINLKAAQAAGLKLNANLLKVAVTVRGKYD